MPTYEYVCRACGHEFEEFQSITAAPIRKCPKCRKSKVERKIGIGAGVLFRGGGFYETDYRSDSYTKSAEAEKKAGESAATTSAGSGTSSDTTKKSDSAGSGAPSERRSTTGDAPATGSAGASSATSPPPGASKAAGAPERSTTDRGDSKATHRSRVGRGIGNILQNPPKPAAQSGAAKATSARPAKKKPRRKA